MPKFSLLTKGLLAASMSTGLTVIRDTTDLRPPSGQQAGQITFFKRSILSRAGRAISGYRAGRHAPGSVVKFRSGAKYLVGPSGQLICAQQKPHSNKAERKALKRDRIASRGLSRRLAMAS